MGFRCHVVDKVSHGRVNQARLLQDERARLLVESGPSGSANE